MLFFLDLVTHDTVCQGNILTVASNFVLTVTDFATNSEDSIVDFLHFTSSYLLCRTLAYTDG